MLTFSRRAANGAMSLSSKSTIRTMVLTAVGAVHWLPVVRCYHDGSARVDGPMVLTNTTTDGDLLLYVWKRYRCLMQRIPARMQLAGTLQLPENTILAMKIPVTSWRSTWLTLATTRIR